MIKNSLHRIAINKFRLGNHHLSIKTGRHAIPKTPENMRICCLCQTNEVENELHFLLFYNRYDTLRLKLFNEITEKNIRFKGLDNKSKILFLFNSIDPTICRSLAAFIFNCMYLRNETLFQKRI